MSMTSRELIARFSPERQKIVLAKSAQINALRDESRRKEHMQEVRSLEYLNK